MYLPPKIDFAPEEVLDYLRKSQADDPDLSVEEVLARHETILDEWAEKNLGAVVPPENKFREVASGETIAGRPEMQRLLRAIESPKYKAVLTVEVQRLSRGDLEDAGKLIRILRYTDTIVITPVKIYDLRDEYDRDAFERELKRGNEFLEYQKKIMRRGRELSVSQGNYIGSRELYGYERTVVMDGKRKCPTLTEKKEEADVVRLIFDMYVNQDMGRHNICKHLDSIGIKPPRGEHWSPPSVRDLLMNVHYIGKVKWNASKTVLTIEDGEVKKTRPRAKVGEYLIYDGKHEAIVDEDLFNRAQEKIGRNARTKAKTKVRNPLAGLVQCSCGRAMSLRTYKLKDGSERCAPRLLCDGQTHCGSGSCLYSEIEDRVIKILEDQIDAFQVRIKSQAGDSVKLHEQMIKNYKVKLKALEAKELAQWEAQSSPDPEERMPAAIFKQLNAKLLQEKEEVKHALCELYDTMPNPVDYTEKMRTFQEALEALRDPAISAEVKNSLLKECIEVIDYKRERPQRVKRAPGEKRGTTLTRGGQWTDPPIELDVKLKI